MKSIFNSLLLCHVLESSISYMLGYQGFNENYDENSQGIEMQFMGIQNNIINSDYGSSDSETCKASRKQCRCQKCYRIKNNCCAQYCKKNCERDDDYYQSYDRPLKMTPEVVIMPYPVPVMVIVNTTTVATSSTGTSDSAIASTKTKATTTEATTTKATTSKATTTKATTTKTSKTTTSTEVREEDSSEMRNTVPPKSDRRSEVLMDYDMPVNKNNKRFKIITKKTYRRNINNPELKPKVKSLPKYGLVNIPEVLKSMIHQLKEERKVLLQEKQKSSYRNKRAVAGGFNQF